MSATQNFLRFFGLVSFVVVGPACKRDNPMSAQPAEVIAAADNASGATDKTPLPGVDVSALEDAKADTFYRLVATLPSPCGKAHSLRTSVTTDTACKRATFAARYVATLLADGAPEAFIQGDYDKRYKSFDVKEIDTSKAPMSGNVDAPVKLVEYFDYACPACIGMKPKLDQALAEHAGKAVLFYEMFPLEARHPDSRSAAKAALAAQAQGKFKEMHEILFLKSPAHKREDVLKYAGALGLDLARFEADYDAADAHVDSDIRQGETLNVASTPTLFLNGRLYTGPQDAKYIGMWIEEEFAVNR
ncbi:MAG: thioredoxin domain-containing protein [Kofleriaceae bacterium]